MIEFLKPEILLGIIPWLILCLFFYYRKKDVLSFGFFHEIQQIYGSNSKYHKYYFGLIFALFVIFLWVLSQPVSTSKEEKIKKNGLDIQIVLDISHSMKSKDIFPTRLEQSKRLITEFLQSRKTDRIGIVVYAGKPFTSVPLSYDYKIISKIVEDISSDSIEQNYFLAGTATWDALVVADDNFDKQSKTREKLIILITDWTANMWISPKTASEYLFKKYKKEEYPLKIYSIWVGSEKASFIHLNDGFWGIQTLEIPPLNDKDLKILSSVNNWKYFRATDSSVFQEIFQEIETLEKREIETEVFVNTQEKNMIFLLIWSCLFFMFCLLKFRKNI